MRYFFARDAVLKWIEKPSVYHIGKDDLYELDSDSFEFLNNCATESGCNVKKDEFIDYCLKEGILTEDKVSLERPLLIKSPDPSLRYLELQITNKCNLKCRHCYINPRYINPPSPPLSKGGKMEFSNKNFNELPVKKIRKVLHEFEQMQGLRVLITGGEPLIHRGFKEINEMLPEFFVRKVLFTNGLLLDKKVLKKLNVNEIQISVDGLEEAHDFLRGKGTFRSTIDAVKRAIDSGFEVSISTMVHAKNLGDFDKMERLFQGLGIKDWTVDIPCITGRLKENPEFQISPEQGGKYLRYGYGNGLHAGASGFACGVYLMAVMADGRVSKCTFYSDSSVGRIEDGLRECWQRIKPVRLNELKCDCMHIESCRGGCRYRAQLLGDPYGKDLYKCNFYDIIKIK
jgi:radical SAM protein with 4Fe4S-binding SPASM domain